MLSNESQGACVRGRGTGKRRSSWPCGRWDVLATVIGEVTDGEHLVIDWSADRRRRSAAHRRPSGPVCERPLERPEWQDDVIADTSASLNRPSTPDELRATTLAMISSPALCSRAFITEQYDRYVRGNTVLAEHADSGMIRIDEETGRGIALATDTSGRYTFLDPYRGAQLALAEAYRNVSVSGAAPVSVYQLPELRVPGEPGGDVAVQPGHCAGLADGCAQLGIPVTGGNVSFYNQTGSTPILPTPVVGVLGVIDDVKRRIPTGFGTPNRGDADPPRGDARRVRRFDLGCRSPATTSGGVPPVVDLEAERFAGPDLVAARHETASSCRRSRPVRGGLIQAAWSVGACGRDRLPDHPCPTCRTPSCGCSPSPPDGAGVGAAHRGVAVLLNARRASSWTTHRRRRPGR